jgi:uncharacterized phage protein (TIGR01671 family)
MREFKFRVWEIPRGTGYKEHQMDYFELDSMFDCDVGCFGREDQILMQWTGLKDKNGKDIYEGDIVDIEKKGFGLYQIKWHTEMASYWMYCIKTGSTFWDGFLDIEKAEVCKIVGNIYENKGLLST